jgi:hypothetical protein
MQLYAAQVIRFIRLQDKLPIEANSALVELRQALLWSHEYAPGIRLDYDRQAVDVEMVGVLVRAYQPISTDFISRNGRKRKALKARDSFHKIR